MTMEKFIPKEKLSKKARKALEAKKRAVWGFSPVTKRVESKKVYDRKKNSRVRYEDEREFFSELCKKIVGETAL